MTNGGISVEEKLRDYFEEMVVYKDLKNNNFFSSLGLPAFLRDYLLKTFSDDYGRFNMDEVSEFIKKFIPKKEEWMRIKNQIIYENETVQLLTKIAVDINIKTGEISFALPDFGNHPYGNFIKMILYKVVRFGGLLSLDIANRMIQLSLKFLERLNL